MIIDIVVVVVEVIVVVVEVVVGGSGSEVLSEVVEGVW